MLKFIHTMGFAMLVMVVGLTAGCAGSDGAGQATSDEVPGAALAGAGNRVHGQRWRDPDALQIEAAPSGAKLIYHGGRVVTHTQVVEVVYGSGSFLPQITSSATPNIPSFYNGVLNSAYVDCSPSTTRPRPTRPHRTPTR